MRRLALLTLGLTVCAPLAACVSTPARPQPGPATTETPAEAAPSVLASAAAPTPPGTTTSYAPAIVVPAEPVKPADPLTPPQAQTPILARPISGGTLRILSNGHTAVASDPDRDQVYVVDLLTGKAQTVALSAGDEPGRIVEDGAGLVHVALRSGGAIATIDPIAGSLVARRAVCSAPRGMAFDGATGELHVACAGGELVTIAATPTATKPLRTLTIERDLRDVVVSTNGRLMVSTFRSAAIYTVGGDGTVSAPHSLSKDFLGNSPGVAWRMVGKSDGTAMMLHEKAQQRAIGTFPGAYGQDTQCGSIVTSTVTVVAPDGDMTTPAPSFTGATVAADVAVSPDGSQLAVVSIASSDAGSQVQFFDVTDGSTTVNGPIPIGSCWPQSAGPRAPDSSGSDTTGDGLPPPDSYLPPNGQIVAVAYDTRGNIIV
jgi:hypothetical protein